MKSALDGNNKILLENWQYEVINRVELALQLSPKYLPAFKKIIPPNTTVIPGEKLNEANRSTKKHEGMPEEMNLFLMKYFASYNKKPEECSS